MTTEALMSVQAIGSIATALGVFLAWWQLMHARRQARTVFEDALAKEYREIALRLPLGAMFEEEIDFEHHPEALVHFYHYIDLSNEQVFLRQNRRVCKQTWISWCGGIQSNLRRPAFQKAWEEIKNRCADFQELRRLEKSGFRDDPASWGRTTA